MSKEYRRQSEGAPSGQRFYHFSLKKKKRKRDYNRSKHIQPMKIPMSTIILYKNRKKITYSFPFEAATPQLLKRLKGKIYPACLTGIILYSNQIALAPADEGNFHFAENINYCR